MPPSDAQRVVEELARQMEGLDRAAAKELVDAYKPVQQNLDKRAAQITRLAQMRALKPWEIGWRTMLTTLRSQVVGELAVFHAVATGIIGRGQEAAIGLTSTGSRMIVDAGLPQLIKLDNLARLGIQWNRVPREAFQAFVGISGDGKPLGELLTRYGAQDAAIITQEIGTGIAEGRGPREVARLARNKTGMPLTKALTVSRTEINRAHREASRLNYANNPNIVKGYRRLAAKDERTCMACISLDRKLYPTNEPLDAHPNCRCAMVPETLTYQDLGLDIPEPPPPESAQQWFQGQSPGVQAGMIKNKRILSAYQDGRIGLEDMVQITSNPVWGKSATVKSAKALGV